MNNGYDITISDGKLLTTINQKTIDNRISSSLIIIGKGVPNLWKTIVQDTVWSLENFSNSLPPVNPLIGQKWYDNLRGRMNYYTGTEWRPLSTPASSLSTLFDMLGTAIDIDFTTISSVPIFMAIDPTKIYCPIFLVLVPNGLITATIPPIIDVSVELSGDVLSSIVIPIRDNLHGVNLTTNITPVIVNSAPNPITYINITTAASGGALHYDAYLFGAIIPIATQLLNILIIGEEAVSALANISVMRSGVTISIVGEEAISALASISVTRSGVVNIPIIGEEVVGALANILVVNILSNFILREDGSYLLREDGSKIIREHEGA